MLSLVRRCELCHHLCDGIVIRRISLGHTEFELRQKLTQGEPLLTDLTQKRVHDDVDFERVPASEALSLLGQRHPRRRTGS